MDVGQGCTVPVMGSMNHRRVFRVLALPFVAVMALLGGAALVSGTATGQVPQPRIIYTVSGTFDDGGTLTGSFIFDPNPACLNRNCPRYSGVNITTSGGDAVYQGTINYTDSDVKAVAVAVAASVNEGGTSFSGAGAVSIVIS